MTYELNKTTLDAGLKNGTLKLLSPALNNSRIILSKIYKGTFVSEPCNGYKICIAIKGNENYYVDKDHFHLSEGQFLMLNKNNLSSAEVNSSTEVTGLGFRINNQYLQQAFHSTYTPVEKLIDDPYSPTNYEFELQQGIHMFNDLPIGKYFRKIIAELDLKNDCLHMDANEIFLEMALQILESQLIINKQKNKIAARKSITKKELYNRLFKAKSLIFENAANNIQIPDIAKEIALSESHFYRSFKKAYGITPHQYLLKNKLHKATELLKNENIDMLQIALNLNFTDLASFSRSFKKQYGLPPSVYRKLIFGYNNLSSFYILLTMIYLI